MSKETRIVCNDCGKSLDHPALRDVQFTYRFNVGLEDCPMGFYELEIKGDFCDVDCLSKYMVGAKFREADKGKILHSQLRTPQDIFFREYGDSGPTLIENKRGETFRYDKGKLIHIDSGKDDSQSSP